jgi:hypothetical protein
MTISRINTQSIANNTIIGVDVVDFSLANTKLSNTGVTSATYGGGSSSQVVVPVFTVANSGQILSAANQSLSLTNFGDISVTSLAGGTLSGSTLTLSGDAAVQNISITGTSTLQQAKEKVTVVAGAATGTINFDALTSAIVYYTSSSTANWTLNFRGDSATTLNSILSTGQSITLAFLSTQGGTGYYPTAFQVDGTTVGVTARWSSIGTPTGGNINCIDAYLVTLIKTASATYTLLGSQTKFFA